LFERKFVMRKTIVALAVILALGACSKPSESHVEAPINSTAPSPSLNPEDSAENVSAASLKYGQSFTYLDGVKVTVSKPKLPKEGIWITDEGQVSDFVILFEAPNGWMSEEGSSSAPEFGFRTTDGDTTATISTGAFFDNMEPGTKKTYQSQLISPKDSWKTGAVTLSDPSGVVASWS
jgi:hypothetical protein